MNRLSSCLFLFLIISTGSAPAAMGQCSSDTSEISAALLEISKGAPNLIIKRFNVSGVAEAQVRAVLDKSGPVDVYGRRRDALTEWTISWQWPGAESGNPDFSKASPSLSLSTTLPCWNDYQRAGEATKEKWNKFVLALVKHEQGHVEIAQNNFERPAQAVRSAAPKRTLDARNANRIAEDELEKIRQLDIKYDQQTESGKKYGVKFP